MALDVNEASTALRTGAYDLLAAGRDAGLLTPEEYREERHALDTANPEYVYYRVSMLMSHYAALFMRRVRSAGAGSRK